MRRRVCFLLAYPGYLRYFDSVVDELVERGYEVRIYFDVLHKQSEGLHALSGASKRVKVGGETPTSKTALGASSRDLRRIIDFLRYLDPRFRDATYLRRRAAGVLPPGGRWLGRLTTAPWPIVATLIRALSAIDRLPRRDAVLDAFVAEMRADVLVVSPLLTIGSPQPDLVRAAQRAGVPTVAAIASWDHLTTKGLLRPPTDAILVWNRSQLREAVDLHGTDRDRVIVTGAQPFDRWFSRGPSRSAEEFRRHVGLPADGPYVLYVGSTASISAPEAEVQFVREWMRRLRSGPPATRELAVLIRPHPFNAAVWTTADISGLGDVVIWPRGGSNPVDADDREDYFDSLSHAAAVVGINTSAMIEAAILDRPVLTVEVPDFAETQGGTLHYHYFLPQNGGFVNVAGDLPAHVRQLAQVLSHDDPHSEERRRFVDHFIRPLGRETPATPRVVAALEGAMGSNEVVTEARPPALVSGVAPLVHGFLMIARFVLDPTASWRVARPFAVRGKRSALDVRRWGADAGRQLERLGHPRMGLLVERLCRGLSSQLVAVVRWLSGYAERRAERARRYQQADPE